MKSLFQTILIFVLGVALFSYFRDSICQAPPTFDPFDEKFEYYCQMDFEQYDSVPGDCGYWTLEKTENGIIHYYQHDPDYGYITGKGFSFPLDTISSEEHIIFYENEMKYIFSRPEYVKKITKSFNTFGLDSIYELDERSFRGKFLRKVSKKIDTEFDCYVYVNNLENDTSKFVIEVAYTSFRSNEYEPSWLDELSKDIWLIKQGINPFKKEENIFREDEEVLDVPQKNY